MKRLVKGTFFFALLLSAISNASQSSAVKVAQNEQKSKRLRFEEFFLPSRYFASVGYGLIPREIFGQEIFFQESWFVSGALHWDCRFLKVCDLLLRGHYQGFLSLPENSTQISITPSESRVGVELGVESRASLPVGISLGYVSVLRKNRLELGTNVSNDSGSVQWSELVRSPSVRLWLGVPLLPQKLSLLVGTTHLYTNDTAAERNFYSSELRFEF